MHVLLKINAGLVAPQLPDEISKFRTQSTAVIEGQLYFFAEYVGAKKLVSDYSVDDYLALDEADKPQEPALIELTNINVIGESVTLGAGNIWWLPKNNSFTITANAALADMNMMIIIERVINGSTVIDDLRAKASIVDGLITINCIFAMSGNYQITAERLNAGLETIGAPFRLAFDKVEFDAHV